MSRRSQKAGAPGQGVCAEWPWQPGFPKGTKAKGMGRPSYPARFVSRRCWAIFWRQATVSGSDKKHLNPIMG